jgi:uroporphyrinogen decarboxylase
MFSEPAAWNELMGKLAETTRRYLLAQIEAGAQAVQLFDSWVGALSPEDYQEHILPHVAHILRDVEATGVPVIHFGTGTATILDLQKQAGGTVIGVDHRLSLSRAHQMLGESVAYQGNLEPMLLLAPWHVLEKRARAVVSEGRPLPGHIFNLGHGIVPETNADVVTRLVGLVHEVSER